MDRRTLLSGLAGGTVAALGGVAIPAATDDHGAADGDNAATDESADRDATRDDEDDLTTKFTLLDPEDVAVDGPEITVDDDAISIRGVINYASSNCGTAELAYASYEATQNRVDVLIAATDDQSQETTEQDPANETTAEPEQAGSDDHAADAEPAAEDCVDDVASVGYRAEITVDGEFHRVMVSEHDAFGASTASVTSR